MVRWNKRLSTTCNHAYNQFALFSHNGTPNRFSMYFNHIDIAFHINKLPYVHLLFCNFDQICRLHTLSYVACIEQVYNLKFLGIVLNSNLKWGTHINKVSNKCTRVIGILNKLKKGLPTRIKVLLYNTLILPHFTYGINGWGFNCTIIKTLQKKQWGWYTIVNTMRIQATYLNSLSF